MRSFVKIISPLVIIIIIITIISWVCVTIAVD